MGLIRRRTACLLAATLVAGTALNLEPAAYRNVSAVSDSHRLTVGAVRVPVWSVAFAQGAGRVSLDDVSLTLGLSTYTIPRIEFSGLTSTPEEVRALFDAASGEPLAARLARISAERVSMPEIVVSEQLGQLQQRTVYRNVVAQDVQRGRVRLASAESATAQGTGPSRGTITQGRSTAEDTDLAAMARLYTEKAGPQRSPLTTVQRSYSGENVTFSEEGGPRMKIARYEMRDLAMRPTKESWSGTLSLFSAMAEIDQPSEDDIKRMLSAVVDAVDAMSVGSAEVTGIEISGQAKVETDGGPKDENFTLGVRRMAYRSATADKPSDARMEGFSLDAADASAKIETISYTGFSFEPTLQGLRAFEAKPLDQLGAEEVRSLIPTIGTIHHSGIVIDVPAKDAPGGRADRLRISLADAEFTAEKPSNGIPTEVRIAIRNLAMPIPADGADESMKIVSDLGYKAVDLSGTVSLGWNEAGQEILVREIALTGAEMGRISLNGVIGGVTRDVFGADSAAAAGALLAATAKTADLTIENGGLFDRYLRQEARRQKKTADALRREYSAAASFAVPLMLGNSEQSRVLGQAVARFIAKPSRLRITARAKNPAGLALADLASLTDPGAALEMLEITAVADERP